MGTRLGDGDLEHGAATIKDLGTGGLQHCGGRGGSKCQVQEVQAP